MPSFACESPPWFTCLEAIFLVDQQAQSPVRHRPASPVAEELAQAQAETERLRQELVPRRFKVEISSGLGPCASIRRQQDG